MYVVYDTEEPVQEVGGIGCAKFAVFGRLRKLLVLEMNKRGNACVKMKMI